MNNRMNILQSILEKLLVLFVTLPFWIVYDLSNRPPSHFEVREQKKKRYLSKMSNRNMRHKKMKDLVACFETELGRKENCETMLAVHLKEDDELHRDGGLNRNDLTWKKW